MFYVDLFLLFIKAGASDDSSELSSLLLLVSSPDSAATASSGLPEINDLFCFALYI